MDFSLILSAIAFPVIVIAFGVVFRLMREVPPIPSTDIFGMLVVLDLAIIQDRDAFAVAVSRDLQHSLLTLAGISMFVCSALWAACVILLEKKLLKYHLEKSSENIKTLVASWLGASLLSILILVFHVLLLTGRLSLKGVA